MITNPLLTDIYRIVGQEAHSALPNAPIRPDRIRPSRGSLLAATRLQLTSALRWAADLLEPATPRAETYPSQDGSRC